MASLNTIVKTLPKFTREQSRNAITKAFSSAAKEKHSDKLAQLENILDELRANPEVRNAYAIGSGVTSKPNPSDIDVFVTTSSPTRKPPPYKGIDIQYAYPYEDEYPGIVMGIRGKAKAIIKAGQEAPRNYGSDYANQITRILGLSGATGGAMGLSDLLSPSEAEASPIGKAFSVFGKKATERIVRNPLSSKAEKLLIGTPFQNQTITDVTKGASNWRHIHLDNGTVVPVTKDVVADMARSTGTRQYVDKFAAQETETSQMAQALRSLQYHLSRSQQFTTRSLLRDYWKNYRNQLLDAGHPTPDLSLVTYKGKNLMMPTEYAKLLAEEKTLGVKIVEQLR